MQAMAPARPAGGFNDEYDDGESRGGGLKQCGRSHRVDQRSQPRGSVVEVTAAWLRGQEEGGLVGDCKSCAQPGWRGGIVGQGEMKRTACLAWLCRGLGCVLGMQAKEKLTARGFSRLR